MYEVQDVFVVLVHGRSHSTIMVLHAVVVDRGALMHVQQPSASRFGFSDYKYTQHPIVYYVLILLH